MIVKIQPMPVALQIAPAGTPDHPETVIVRGWNPGDIPRCRLCPICKANLVGNFCTVVTPGIIPGKDAALFRLTAEMLGMHGVWRPRIALN